MHERVYSEELEIEIVMKTRSEVGLLTKLTGWVAGRGSLVLLQLWICSFYRRRKRHQEERKVEQEKY